MKLPPALRPILDLRPGEWQIASLMFSYFLLVITSFWILKPIKKTLFLAYYSDRSLMLFGAALDGPDAEQIAKVLNMVVAAVAVVAFTALSRRLRRQQLTYVFSGFFLLAYAVFAPLLSRPGALGVWTFYLAGDLFSTLMVATFFAFLNDSVTPDQAKRLYGIVGLGGVIGGVFGASVVAGLILVIATAEWLMVAAVLVLLIVLVAGAAGRRVGAADSAGAAHPKEARPDAVNPAIAGARLVFRSRYLLCIVALVGIYEIVSTILDYQFTKGIVHFVPDEDAQRQHFASVFAFTAWVSLFVQLFLTSFVMRRFGLATALLILPLSILAVSAGFFILPSLWIASAINTADNGFSYSLNQSAREALYVPTSVEEKYQAKAFIDMFVQRFAKALAVGISLGVAVLVPDFGGVRWLTLVLIPLLVVWVFAAAFAGRHFAALAEPPPGAKAR